MVVKKAVPMQTAIRFETDERRKGIEDSMKKRNLDNLSEWLRAAIDVRLYFEQRGYEMAYILSGDYLHDIENSPAQTQSVNNPETDSILNKIDEAAFEQLVKMILRNHALSKSILQIVADNPNINTKPDNSYESITTKIQNSANVLYSQVFDKK